MEFNAQQLQLFLIKLIEDSFGFERIPQIVLNTTPFVAPTGTFIYAIKAKGSSLVFSAAKDTQDTPQDVVLLDISQDDIEFFPLSQFTLTSGKAYVYLANIIKTK